MTKKRETQFRATGDPFGNPEDSWAPAVRSCVLSVCQSWASGDPWRTAGDSWELAVGYCMFFCFSISGLRGPLGDSWGLLGSSCRISCVLFVFQVRASGDPWGTPADSWATAFVYFVSFFCLSISDPGGPLGDSWGFLCSSCQILCVLFVCQFRASGDPWEIPGQSKLCVLFSFVNFGLQGIPETLGDS